MRDILCRREGKVGRITLQRPKALNALSHAMIAEIERAIDSWWQDNDVNFVMIEGIGERAFSAGGDIQDMYDTATRGDFEYGRRFWRDEYRLNAKIFNFPKPWVAFMQGFTMGGGVGVSCHGSHRVVCENSIVAMPECGIGLVPDVGGSLLLARAPGRMGEYLGTTGTRMGPADAIYAGFADYFAPNESWEEIKADLVETGEVGILDDRATVASGGVLHESQREVDRHFGGETIADILRSMSTSADGFTEAALSAISRNCPLSVACCVEIVHRARESDTIFRALREEFRFTFRSAEHGDFVEGIRAAVIDRDRNPRWRHADIDAVSDLDVVRMLMPLGGDELRFEREGFA